jgi:hypothetical protein
VAFLNGMNHQTHHGERLPDRRVLFLLSFCGISERDVVVFDDEKGTIFTLYLSILIICTSSSNGKLQTAMAVYTQSMHVSCICGASGRYEANVVRYIGATGRVE